MLLQWSKDLSVGHPILDNDHQMLINIANDLAHAHHSSAGADTVGRSLERLAQYIETHFRREEELFLDSNYPHKEKHQRNHRDIEQLFRGFQAAHEKDPAVVDMGKLLSFLREWLLKHIGKLDKGYSDYVAAAEKHHGQYQQRTGFI